MSTILTKDTQQGVATRHENLRYDPDRKYLMLYGHVDPDIVLAEARRLGAITTTGGTRYCVEAKVGGRKNAQGGTCSEDGVRKMLEELRD